MFEQGVEGIKAAAEYVHVFVDKDTGRSTEQGITDTMRKGLERILEGQPSFPQSQL